MVHPDELDEAIMHSRDYDYHLCVTPLCLSSQCLAEIIPSYSLHTLYRFYLLQKDGVVVERPQFLFMRVAVAIHGQDLARVLETYELLSNRAYTPATPVLYNAGTSAQYLASCFIHQPRIDTTLSVLGSSVASLGTYWTADGGVGMNLGSVPAREYVAHLLHISPH